MNFGEQKIKAHLREMESLGGKYRRRMLHQICLLGVLVLVWAAAAGIAAGAGMIKGIIDLAPQVSLADLEPQGFATQIYDSQGNLTETLVMSGANREEASYEEFPEHLVQAFVSMEDRRFWEHNGIDLRSIMRADFRPVRCRKEHTGPLHEHAGNTDIRNSLGQRKRNDKLKCKRTP